MRGGMLTRWWCSSGKTSSKQAAITTIETRTPARVKRIPLSYRPRCLFIGLSSERQLCYPRPRLGENRFGVTSIIFDGVVGTTRKWVQIETYGGKLTENHVQATERDLLTHAMRQVDAAGHRMVMHIRDEIVVDEPVIGSSVKEVVALMTQLPAWADGLPLDADGY